MKLTIENPVQFALAELEQGGVSLSQVFYYYLLHCRAVAERQVDQTERQCLPALNSAIAEKWSVDDLKTIKAAAWDVIMGKLDFASAQKLFTVKF